MNTRWRCALAAAVVLPAGYGLRFAPALPEWVRDGSGGLAYVVLLAMLAGVAWPQVSAARLALGALATTCVVEVSQLWHPAWLDGIRRTLPGRLVLGSTFGWSDFPPYVAGAIAGWALLRWLQRR